MTESTRVALLVPVFEHQIVDALNFVGRYEKMCMESQDNTFLMLVSVTATRPDVDNFINVFHFGLDIPIQRRFSQQRRPRHIFATEENGARSIRKVSQHRFTHRMVVDSFVAVIPTSQHQCVHVDQYVCSERSFEFGRHRFGKKKMLQNHMLSSLLNR